MTDRELLKLAAVACGELCGEWVNNDAYFGGVLSRWNPLTDDGDALRLAIKLGIDLHLPSSPNQVFVQVGERGSVPFVLERIDGDPYAATRRAIVRAAAEIGKDMK